MTSHSNLAEFDIFELAKIRFVLNPEVPSTELENKTLKPRTFRPRQDSQAKEFCNHPNKNLPALAFVRTRREEFEKEK